MSQQELDPSTIPVSQPPPGVTANLVDPPSQMPSILATITITIVLTSVALAIRLFTKIHVLRKLLPEDGLLILSQAFYIPWCIFFVVEPVHGADIWNVSVAKMEKHLYWEHIIMNVYIPCILLAKWAVLLQLQRIFTIQPRDKTWWTVRVLIVVSTATYITVLFMSIFQCVPRQKVWKSSVSGHCLDIGWIFIATSTFNVVLNLFILALPLVVVCKMQMYWRKRIIVTVIFGITILAVTSSMVRVVYSIRVVKTTNSTRDITPVGNWAVAEIACINFATSVPTVPRFIEYVRGTCSRHSTSAPHFESPKQENSSTLAQLSSFYVIQTDAVGNIRGGHESEITVMPSTSADEASKETDVSPESSTQELSYPSNIARPYGRDVTDLV